MAFSRSACTRKSRLDISQRAITLDQFRSAFLSFAVTPAARRGDEDGIALIHYELPLGVADALAIDSDIAEPARLSAAGPRRSISQALRQKYDRERRLVPILDQHVLAQASAELARATSEKEARAGMLMAWFAVTVSALAVVTAIVGEDGEVIASTLIWLAFSVSVATLTGRVLAARRRLDRRKSL